MTLELTLSRTLNVKYALRYKTITGRKWSIQWMTVNYCGYGRLFASLARYEKSTIL